MMKRILLCLIMAYMGMGTVFAQDCLPVASPTDWGQPITFYAYSYHTNRFNMELRVSPVFQITYIINADSAQIDHSKIAVRLSQDFMFYVRDMYGDQAEKGPPPPPHTPNPIASSTLKKVTVLCKNADYVIAHRNDMIESFEKLDKVVIEENAYQFEYRFSDFYLKKNRNTVVNVVKM